MKHALALGKYTAMLAIRRRFCQAAPMRRRLAVLPFPIAVVAIAATSTAARATAAADTYRFDPVHTQVWFGVDHQHFSHPQGRLRIKSGLFAFDDKDWSHSRVDVTIDLTALDMGDKKWNDTVKSGQFLDTARYPTARYISRSVEKKTERDGVIHGDLYFHGEKKPVDVAFTRNRIGTDPYLFKRKAGFSATAKLSRSLFVIKRYADVVGETVDLRFEVEGIVDDDAKSAPAQESAPAKESADAAQE